MNHDAVNRSSCCIEAVNRSSCCFEAGNGSSCCIDAVSGGHIELYFEAYTLRAPSNKHVVKI